MSRASTYVGKVFKRKGDQFHVRVDGVCKDGYPIGVRLDGNREGEFIKLPKVIELGYVEVKQ